MSLKNKTTTQLNYKFIQLVQQQQQQTTITETKQQMEIT